MVFLLLTQTFLAEGLLTSFVVSSGSMSPSLHGPHYMLRCPDCETAFCIETGDPPQDSQNAPPLRWGTCPACAFAQTPVPKDAFCMGDRILVNRAALSLRPIRRWDVVLFRTPDDGTLTVKRVVGLPGETLEIRDGDIVIDGRIVTKPLALQRAMRIPVPFGRWEMQAGKDPGQCEFAWRPVRNVPHVRTLYATNDASQRDMESDTASDGPLFGVTNQLCENQWRIEPPGGIFPVRDLTLEFDWQPDATRPLGIRAHTDERRLDFGRANGGTHKIEISLFDRRLLVAVDGAVIADSPFDDFEISGETNLCPFAFRLPESDGLSQTEQETALRRQITNPRAWRDVYYMNQDADAVTIPPGCYYLLGDNSAFSADSRGWNEPFVTQRHLVGIVTRWEK